LWEGGRWNISNGDSQWIPKKREKGKKTRGESKAQHEGGRQSESELTKDPLYSLKDFSRHKMLGNRIVRRDTRRLRHFWKRRRRSDAVALKSEFPSLSLMSSLLRLRGARDANCKFEESDFSHHFHSKSKALVLKNAPPVSGVKLKRSSFFFAIFQERPMFSTIIRKV